MDAENTPTQLDELYSIRAKARKALERIKDAGHPVPREVKLAYSRALAECDKWLAQTRRELGYDEESAPAQVKPVDPDLLAALQAAREENAALKAATPVATKTLPLTSPRKMRALQVTRINPR